MAHGCLPPTLALLPTCTPTHTCGCLHSRYISCSAAACLSAASRGLLLVGSCCSTTTAPRWEGPRGAAMADASSGATRLQDTSGRACVMARRCAGGGVWWRRDTMSVCQWWRDGRCQFWCYPAPGYLWQHLEIHKHVGIQMQIQRTEADCRMGWRRHREGWGNGMLGVPRAVALG